MWPCSGHYRISKLSCKQRGTKTDSAPSGAGPSCSCPCTTCDCCWIQGLGLGPQAMMPHWATDIIVTTCISRVISKLIQTLVQTACHLQPIWSSGGCKLLLWVTQHRPGVGCPTLEASTLARKLRRVQLTLLHLLFSCKCSDFIFPIQKVTPFLCLIYMCIYIYIIYIYHHKAGLSATAQMQFQKWILNIWVRRHLRRSTVSPSAGLALRSIWSGHSGFIQVGLENVQGWRQFNSPGQTAPIRGFLTVISSPSVLLEAVG